MPRKHLIASSINKKQQLQSKIALKCIREIKAAVKVGGENIDANPRLKTAIAKALQNNVTMQTIQRNISNCKDTENLKELYYEAYGPKGLAIIVKAVTDNEQRTVSNLRGYLSKLRGELSKPNSVRMLFNECGQFILSKEDLTYDKLLETTLSLNIIDIKEDDSAFELLVSPNNFFDTKNLLDQTSYKILDANVKLIPTSFVDITEDEDKLLERFLDSCDNDDDIQWVVTNVGEIL